MVRIEVELMGENVKNEIYDLRNYLRDKMPEVDFAIKEQPQLPGQMGIDLVETVLNGLIHASAAIAFEELYRNLLKPLLNSWLKSRQSAGIQLEVMSSLSDSQGKARFLEDSTGETQVYNYKYKIDTDKTLALLIGVGKFSEGFQAIPPVQGNLEDLYKLLTSPKHIGIPRENVTVSYNESHVDIQKQLLQAGRRQDIQTVLIYFAGHGHRTDVKKLSLIATDTEKVGDEIIGGIDFDFISNKILKNSIATQKILILDTCHSGIATQGSDNLAQNFDVKGSYILTSSPGDDVSYFEKNARHTFFTGALLDVLETGLDNTNEMLALDDLYNYTREALIEKKFPRPNAKSELNISPADFFIARNPSFSSEKLKWRAYNLFRDGSLEEALDELRKLLKRFPGDENLRRQFEECETELSFSKYVNEANTLFYQSKNFSQAAVLYRKAYELKKDSMILEKIRQCDKSGTVSLPPDRLESIKSDGNYKAYQNAIQREAFYAAHQYLIKLFQSHADNDFVKEEFKASENRLRNLSGGTNDRRLVRFYELETQGKFEQALGELDSQISNDPEYPLFQQLQRATLKKIKNKKEEEAGKENALLFRIFQSFGNTGKVVLLLSVLLLVGALLTIYFIRADKNYSLAELEDLLTSNPGKALPLLKSQAKKNDSVKVFLGDYYRKTGDFSQASTWYADASLPYAMSAIGAMYYNKELTGTEDSAKAKVFFTKALELGTDTNANNYLGKLALEKYIPRKDSDFVAEAFGDDAKWLEAKKNFEEGYRNGSITSQQLLGQMYYDRGKQYEREQSFDKAHTYFLRSINYDNVPAMVNLGFIFGNFRWSAYNRDSSEKWYRRAAARKNPKGLNDYATVFLRRVPYNPANYDTAYELLWEGRVINRAAPLIAFNLGRVFQRGGYHVNQNRDSVIYYFSEAAKEGNKSAQDSLSKNPVSY